MVPMQITLQGLGEVLVKEGVWHYEGTTYIGECSMCLCLLDASA
jgi:hypothetical protein